MISMFRSRRSTLNVSILLLRGSAALQTCALACFFANRIVRSASSGDNVQIAWQALDIVRMSFSVAVDNIWCKSVARGMSNCVAGAVFSTLYTPHCTLTL